MFTKRGFHPHARVCTIVAAVLCLSAFVSTTASGPAAAVEGDVQSEAREGAGAHGGGGASGGTGGAEATEPQARALAVEYLQRAREEVENVREEQRRRAFLYKRIVAYHVHLGDIAAAKRTAKRVSPGTDQPGSYHDSAYEFIAIGQARAGEFEGAKATATRITCEHTQDEAYAAIAVELAAAGELDRAHRIIPGLIDVEQQIETHARIAVRQMQLGRDAEAQASFERARRRIERIDVPVEDGEASLWNARFFTSLAGAQLHIDDRAGAMNNLQRARRYLDEARDDEWLPEFERDTADRGYMEIAGLQLEAGDHAGAGESLARLEGAVWEEDLARHVYYTRFIHPHLEAARFDDAINVAESTPDQAMRDHVLDAIAAAQARAGDFTGARKTAAAIEDTAQSNRSLAWVTRVQAESGEVQAARKAAESIADQPARDRALLALAKGSLERGDIARAQEVAARITDQDDRADIYQRIVDALAQDGRWAEAGEWAEAIDRAATQSWAHHAIALARARAGDTGKAMAMAEAIQHAHVRATAYTSVAAVFDDHDEPAAASRALNFAEAAAGRIEDPARRGRMWTDVALGWFGAGDAARARSAMDHALASAREQGRDAEETYAYRVIIRAWISMREFAIARELAQAIEDVPRQSSIMHQIIRAQLDYKDVQGAMVTALATADESRRARALGLIVQAKIDSGDLDAARKVAVTIDSRGQQTDALWAIAEAEAEAGDHVAAAKTLGLMPGRGAGFAFESLARTAAEDGDVEAVEDLLAAAELPECRIEIFLGAAEGVLGIKEDPFGGIPDEEQGIWVRWW